MPRKPRFFVADIPTHVVQRGNNRQAIFFADNDYRIYLGWLAEAAKRWSCAVHAYVLMTNHVHLLVTPQDREGVSRMMQYLRRRYVPYVNHEYGRTGTLWEGRFKSSLVQARSYLLACYRYIELNPVRAGMVEVPANYTWSSYRGNAIGEEDPILSAHADYLALGRSDSDRRSAYRALFATHLNQSTIMQLRESLQTGTPLGNDRFRAQIEHALGRAVGFSRRGRPKKPIEASSKESVRHVKQLPIEGVWAMISSKEL
jgi:putative transposase